MSLKKNLNKMWTILKINKKKLNILKKEVFNKLGEGIIFYQPKMKIEKYKKKKLKNIEIDILGDYVFCFHKKLECQKKINEIKFCCGLKYFLDGYREYQNEISNFIEKLKSLENKEGYVSKSFFEINKNSYYKFSSGPFTEKFFKIIEIQNTKISVLLGKLKTTFNQKDHLISQA